MNCTSCGKPVKEGSPKCPSCGAKISSSDEIDLMPMEEAKEAAYSPYSDPTAAPEPGAAAPAAKKGVNAPEGPLIPIARRPREPEPESLLQNRKVQIVGGAVGAVLLIILLYFIFHTTNKVMGRFKGDFPTMNVNPNPTVVNNFVVVGHATYQLEVTPVDGDLQVGVAKRPAKDSTFIQNLKKLSYQPAPKGQTTTVDGVADGGEWSWFLFNEGKKAVKAKVKFLAEPQK